MATKVRFSKIVTDLVVFLILKPVIINRTTKVLYLSAGRQGVILARRANTKDGVGCCKKQCPKDFILPSFRLD